MPFTPYAADRQYSTKQYKEGFHPSDGGKSLYTRMSQIREAYSIGKNTGMLDY